MSTAAATITYKAPKRRHPVLLFMTQQPLGAAGLVIIVLMGICAGFAPWVAPYDPLTVDYGTMLGPMRYDELAHLLVQAFATPLVIWIAREWCERAGLSIPLGLSSFCAASAMFSLSAFYEVLELWDELVFGGQRIWSLHDTAEDLQWDLFGIVLGVILTKLVFRRNPARSALK